MEAEVVGSQGDPADQVGWDFKVRIVFAMQDDHILHTTEQVPHCVF